ncbi:phosphopantetheine-binding protein [Elusimicrobiota bacterium]
MNRELIKDEIINIIAIAAEVPKVEIEEKTVVQSSLDVDSLVIVKVLAAIEQKYSIVIDELAASEVETLENLVDLVCKIIEEK